MPRDGSGLYSLPAGNPVVTGTIIASAWANSTLGDIAAQLNNVFTRDGLLGPTAPFKIVDGTITAPGLAWNSEPGLGWYRPGAGRIGVAVGGQSIGEISAAGFKFGVRGLFADGTVAEPAIAFTSETGLGFYRFGAGNIRLAKDGKDAFSFNTTANTAGILVQPAADGGSSISIQNGPESSPNRRELSIWMDSNNINFVSGAYGAGVKLNTIFNGSSIYTFGGQVRVKTILQVGDGAQTGGMNIWRLDGQESQIQWVHGGVSRWYLAFGSDNHLGFARTNDSGAYLSTPLRLNRDNGDVEVGQNMTVAIQAYKPGGGDWAVLSDIRVKDVQGGYTQGLDAVLQLNPVVYNYKSDKQRSFVGLVAQEAMVPMPEMVTVAPGEMFGVKLDDMHTMDTTPLIYALVNAVKTLHARIAALETA